MTTLLITQIQTVGLQARVTTDGATVDEYAEAMRSNSVLPPLVVFSDGQEYWLADGFHRLSALQQIGAEVANVMVREGTRDDAMWFAVAANKTHGLKRTNADKRKAVSKALELHPEMSDRAIAEHIGVTHPFVASLRPKPENESGGNGFQVQVPQNQGSDQKETPKPPKLSPPPPPPKRVGLDGKSYPPPPPPPIRRPAPPEAVQPAKPKRQLDKIGREIPEKLQPLWDQAAAMQVHITAISKLRCEIRRDAEEMPLVFAEASLNRIHAEIDNAYTHMAVVLPYTICPTCQGQIPQGCRLCGERGYISEHRWKVSVPKETKDIILATIEA